MLSNIVNKISPNNVKRIKKKPNDVKLGIWCYPWLSGVDLTRSMPTKIKQKTYCHLANSPVDHNNSLHKGAQGGAQGVAQGGDVAGKNQILGAARGVKSNQNHQVFPAWRALPQAEEIREAEGPPAHLTQ